MGISESFRTLHEAMPSRIACLLGLAGLLPFATGAVAVWMLTPDMRPPIAAALVAYGATIVAFLGGLHWGLAARGASSDMQYLWGVTPSLLAWGALLLPERIALVVLAASLVACYVVDRRVLPAQGLRRWLPLRVTLTTVAAASCAAAAFAL